MTDIIEGEIVDGPEPEAEEKMFTAKGVAKFVVRSSVKFVIAGAITSLVPEAETKLHKVKLAVGTYVIADMVAKNTGTYVEEKLDGWKKDFQEVHAMVKKLESKSDETPNQ